MNPWWAAMSQLRPPPRLKPSEWAERNVVVPQETALAGPIRFANAEYQREPLDVVEEQGIEEVSLMWGTQLGKTLISQCVLGFYVGHKPMPQMLVEPREADVDVWLESKFDPMLEANPALRGRFGKKRGGGRTNTKTMKKYPGGFLTFGWSGSPDSLRQKSIAKLHLDEIDAYRQTAEGDPIALSVERTNTFQDRRLVFKTSTPLVKGSSKIEQAYLAGDQRKYWVPCVHCDEYQTLEWAQVRWDKDDSGDPDPETARYHCVHCDGVITDADKVSMIQRGEWRAQKETKRHASFHLSGLYSPFMRWRQFVEKFIKAREHEDLQTFVNTVLAETWEEQNLSVSVEQLRARAEEYGSPVPRGGLVLTAGVDVQGDRIEVEVVAWGPGFESWSIDHAVFYGDTTTGSPWGQLDRYLKRTWETHDGSQLGVAATCVDTGGTGDATVTAYDWCAPRFSRKIFAIKGVGGWGKSIVRAPTKVRGRGVHRTVRLFSIAVDEAKREVVKHLHRRTRGPYYCHFPADRDPEWFRQLTAEKLVTRYRKGHPVMSWEKVRERNEALDLRVYAYAAMRILQPEIGQMAVEAGLVDEHGEPVKAGSFDDGCRQTDDRATDRRQGDPPPRRVYVEREADYQARQNVPDDSDTNDDEDEDDSRKRRFARKRR